MNVTDLITSISRVTNTVHSVQLRSSVQVTQNLTWFEWLADLSLYGMTDADVSLNGKRESKPDAGVAGSVCERSAER